MRNICQLLRPRIGPERGTCAANYEQKNMAKSEATKTAATPCTSKRLPVQNGHRLSPPEASLNGRQKIYWQILMGGAHTRHFRDANYVHYVPGQDQANKKQNHVLAMKSQEMMPIARHAVLLSKVVKKGLSKVGPPKKTRNVLLDGKSLQASALSALRLTQGPTTVRRKCAWSHARFA